MIKYILKRLAYSLVALYIVITATFFLMHAVPGNVFTGEKNLPPAIQKNLKAKYGLDKPLHVQYFTTLGNIVKLDFGMSMQNEGRSVNDMITEYFPRSAAVGLFAIVICLLLGIPLGVISALRHGKWQDNLSMLIATLGVTIPSFVIATLLQYFIGLKLRLLPVMGYSSFLHLILPAIALAFYPLSFVARLVRSSMVEVMEQDYIRTAKAKGLSHAVVVYKHALKNSVLPIISYMGPLIASILVGSLVVEKIFNIPGLGRHFYQSVSNRDYTTIMGVTVFFAAILIMMNWIVDVIYVFVDPRIKLGD